MYTLPCKLAMGGRQQLFLHFKAEGDLAAKSEVLFLTEFHPFHAEREEEAGTVLSYCVYLLSVCNFSQVPINQKMHFGKEHHNERYY